MESPSDRDRPEDLRAVARPPAMIRPISPAMPGLSSRREGAWRGMRRRGEGSFEDLSARGSSREGEAPGEPDSTATAHPGSAGASPSRAGLPRGTGRAESRGLIPETTGHSLPVLIPSPVGAGWWGPRHPGRDQPGPDRVPGNPYLKHYYY